MATAAATRARRTAAVYTVSYTNQLAPTRTTRGRKRRRPATQRVDDSDDEQPVPQVPRIESPAPSQGDDTDSQAGEGVPEGNEGTDAPDNNHEEPPNGDGPGPDNPTPSLPDEPAPPRPDSSNGGPPSVGGTPTPPRSPSPPGSPTPPGTPDTANSDPIPITREIVDAAMLYFRTRATEESASEDILENIRQLRVIALDLADRSFFIDVFTVRPDGTSPDDILGTAEGVVWSTLLDFLDLVDDGAPPFEWSKIMVTAEMDRLQYDLLTQAPPQAMLDEMDRLRIIAEELADNEYFINIPTMIPADASADEILVSVKEVVWRTRLDSYEDLWDEAIAVARTQYGEAAAVELGGAFDYMLVEFDTLLLEPRLPGRDFCEIAWRYAAITFAGENPQTNTAARFNDLHQWAIDDARERKTYILPPTLVGRELRNSWCEYFCEEIAVKIRAIRQTHYEEINAAWVDWQLDAIDDDADDGGQVEILRRSALHDAMIAIVQAGGWPYLPEEAVWREPPLWLSRANWDRITKELGFGGGRSGIPGTWHWVKQLGQGGFGNASLWVRYSANLRVIDRKVVKDIYAVFRGGAWDDPSWWRGPVEDRVPAEYALARKANQSVGGETIVRLDGYGTYEDRAMIRLYSGKSHPSCQKKRVLADTSLAQSTAHMAI